jgi:hypothetical protein
MVGVLDGNPKKSMLVISKFVTVADHTTVMQCVNDACMLLWPNGIQYNKLLLIVSDQAKYMLKAMERLKNYFPKLNHVSCLANALSLTCESIRGNCDNVNNFITLMKFALKNSPKRIQKFKDICNKMPPTPIITRWGSWISTAVFRLDNFDAVKIFTKDHLKSNAKSIAKLIFLINSEELQNE